MLRTAASSKTFFSSLLVLCGIWGLGYLPTAQAMPLIETGLQPDRFSVGQTCSYSIRVFWDGAADDYRIAAPTPVLPDGLTAVSSSTAATTNGSTCSHTYRFTLAAQHPGPFTINPVAVTFWLRGEQEARSLITAETSGEIIADTFWGMTVPGMLAGGGAAALLLAATLTFCLAQRRSRAARPPEPHPGAGRQAVAEALQRCNQSRHAGDSEAFLRHALALARALPGGDPSVITALETALQDMRFGGFRPTTRETEQMFRPLAKKAEQVLSAGGPPEPVDNA